MGVGGQFADQKHGLVAHRARPEHPLGELAGAGDLVGAAGKVRRRAKGTPRLSSP